LLEIGLRIAGYFYNKRLKPSEQEIQANKNVIKILCIGDSYTVGGRVSPKYAYPAQLERKLSENSRKEFKVINGGRCEANSSQILNDLYGLIDTYHPDYTIVLIGSANKFNLDGYETFKQKMKSEHTKGGVASNFKAYKVFKILKANLKNKILKWKAHQIDESSEENGLETESSRDIENHSKFYFQDVEKETEEALTILKDNPNDDITYVNLGIIYYDKRRYKQAEKMFKKALELNPENKSAYESLRIMYGEQRNFDEERKMLERMLKVFPEDSNVYYLLGRFYNSRKKFKIAEWILKKGKAMDSMNPNLYEELKTSYDGMGMFEEANEIEKEKIRIILMKIKKMEEEKYFDKAYKEYIRLGKSYKSESQFKKAEEAFKRAVKINPDRGTAYGDLGFLFIETGDYATAVKYFTKSLPYDYDNSTIYYFLSRAYDFQIKYDSVYMVNQLKNLLKEKPYLKESKLFMRYVKYFKNMEEWEKKIRDWLQYDLEKIVDVCRKESIKVIMMNYPHSYSLANEILEKVAAKYSIPFVDNNSVFKKLLNNNSSEKYFVDYHHCTAEGHRMMVENMYNMLIEENIVIPVDSN